MCVCVCFCVCVCDVCLCVCVCRVGVRVVGWVLVGVLWCECVCVFSITERSALPLYVGDGALHNMHYHCFVITIRLNITLSA